VASEVLKIDLKGSDSTGAAFASLQRSMSGISKSFSTLQSVVKGSLGLLVAGGIGEAIGSVRQYADAWTGMTNKLKSGGLDIAQAAIAQQKIIDIASSSRSTLSEVGNLYGRIAFATENLGTSQSDVSKMTETLSKAFKLSGKTALEAQSAVTQFTQALSSGVLQGDELRSLRENAPEIARAIADSFGVTVGALKELGAEGKLTADKIVPAILDASEKIDARFATTRKTFEDYGIAISNYFQTAIGSMQEFLQQSDEMVAADANVKKQSQQLGLVPTQQDTTNLDIVKKKTEDNIRLQIQYYETIKKLEYSILSREKPIDFMGIKVTGENLETATRMSDALVFSIRDVFFEFKQTKRTSDDLLKLGSTIKNLVEQAGLKPDDKLLVYLLELTSTAAVAYQAFTALQGTIDKIQGTKEMGMSMGGKTPIVPEFKPLEIRSNNSKQAMEEMDAFRKKYFLNNQYYIKTASEQEKLALELIADAKKNNIKLTIDQARVQAEAIIKQNDAGSAAKKYGNDLEKTGNKVEKFLIGQQAQIDQLNLEREAMSMSTEQFKVHSEQIKYQAELNKLLVGKSPEMVAAFRAEADALQEKKIAAMAANDEFKRSFEYGMIKGMENVRDTTLNVASAVDSAWTNAFSGLEDALVSFVTTGKADFKSLANSIIADLIRIQIRSMLAGIFGGGSGFNLGSLFGFGSTGGYSPPTFGPRAAGGPVSANSPYIVGEKGPELFMPGSSGSIVPNNALGGNSGGGVTINQTINISTGVQQTVRAEIQQLLPQISNAAKNAVVDAKRRGGSFAMAFGG